MILRARAVLPITGPLVSDGAVRLSGRRVVAVGKWRDLAGARRDTVDLGDSVVLPGLINAHCHLDYTDMAGRIPPTRSFVDWLKVMTVTKATWETEDFAASWRNGAQALLESGTTTVADIEAVPQLLPEAWQATPLRVISLLEMIGLTAKRPAVTLLRTAVEKIASLQHPRCRAGLSPHAPYTTLPELLRLAAAAAGKHRWLVCTHVAESALEFAMFTRGEGEMFDWLQRSGRDMSDCGLGSPVAHLAKCGLLGKNLLAAHVNYLGRHDAALLARNHVSVVHCPRSHAYFRHGQFLLRRLVRAGVNVCLGTDSLASIHKTRRHRVNLDLFAEMRALADRETWLSPKGILRLATVNGARALGLPRLGGLAPNVLADLIALPFTGKPAHVYDSILAHTGQVTASMIDGRWAIPPPDSGS